MAVSLQSLSDKDILTIVDRYFAGVYADTCEVMDDLTLDDIDLMNTCRRTSVNALKIMGEVREKLLDLNSKKE